MEGKKYKRIFVLVIDSLGIGEMPDSSEYGDIGVNTLQHISESRETFCIPNLTKLGISNLTDLKQIGHQDNVLGCYMKLSERSRGKDTMTGHWEMMGDRKSVV